jgi:uncharacterized protein YegL
VPISWRKEKLSSVDAETVAIFEHFKEKIMPKLGDSVDLRQHQAGHFQYTAIAPDALAEKGSTEQTLVTLVIDRSGSTSGFENKLENALKAIIKGCGKCPRSDFLLLRILLFDSSTPAEEVHGFKPLSTCLDSNGEAGPQYNNIISSRGMTALYDVSVDAIEATADFGRQLIEQDYDCNAVIAIITDGMDTASTYGISEVKKAFEKAMRSECLESLVSVLVALNPKADAEGLRRFNEDGGFTSYQEIDDLTDDNFAKLADWISESISSQSQALGTGGPSKVPDPTF